MTSKKQVHNKAWIVRWVAYGDEEKIMTSRGLSSDVIDILSARHKFDSYIVPYAKNLYRQKILSLSERFNLAHYNNMSASKNMFKGSVSICNYYSSNAYKKWAKCMQETSDPTHCVKLHSGHDWKKYPEHVTVGHNPAVEIRKVFNLEMQTTDMGTAILSWDEPQPDFTTRRCSQETKDLIY